jgi:hypothetical protein
MNLSVGSFALETGTFACRFGGWAVAFTADLLENFARPGVRLGPDFGGVEVEQSGTLRDWNVAAARRLGRRFSLGPRGRRSLASGRLHDHGRQVGALPGLLRQRRPQRRALPLRFSLSGRQNPLPENGRWPQPRPL